jgi:quaternary ammonium compound-resistance protein SugE
MGQYVHGISFLKLFFSNDILPAFSCGDDLAFVREHGGDDPVMTWEKTMHWIVLILAGLLEVVWAVGLKYTEGFSKLVPSAVTLTAMAGSVGLLGLALRSLPLGTAYAIWTGIGTVGTVIYGIMMLNEPAGIARLVCIAMIVAGILGLKLLSAH